VQQIRFYLFIAGYVTTETGKYFLFLTPGKLGITFQLDKPSLQLQNITIQNKSSQYLKQFQQCLVEFSVQHPTNSLNRGLFDTSYIPYKPPEARLKHPHLAHLKKIQVQATSASQDTSRKFASVPICLWTLSLDCSGTFF